jgi:hypothetical protein
LGSRPVKLFKVRVQATEAVLAVSSRTWLGYHYQNRFHLTPLSYECLEYAAGFSSGNFLFFIYFIICRRFEWRRFRVLPSKGGA